MWLGIFTILPIFLILLSSIVIPFSFASVESESQEDIQAGCRDAQTMVIRYSSNEYVCVDPDTADRWRELGVAKIIFENPKDIEKNDSEDIPVKDNLVEDLEFPGAPPKKTTSIESSECREGYTLVYRLTHHDTFCTSPSTANMWEMLDLAKIITSDELIFEESSEESSNDVTTLSNFSDIPKLYPLNDRIWVAVGYDSTNTLLIEGDSGIIVIDTLSSYDSAKKVLKDFRMFSEKPIEIIIYTQENSDLLLGSKAFVDEGDGSVEIIAPKHILEFL